MIVEEKEANKYICCNASYQRQMNCSGSKCMAWKWKRKIVSYKPGKFVGGYMPPMPATPIFENTTMGYCGLAYDNR